MPLLLPVLRVCVFIGFCATVPPVLGGVFTARGKMLNHSDGTKTSVLPFYNDLLLSLSPQRLLIGSPFLIFFLTRKGTVCNLLSIMFYFLIFTQEHMH